MLVRTGRVVIEQARYQIRFDWGLDGAAAIATDADVLVWVDAIATSPVLDTGQLPAGPSVIAASLTSAASTAASIVGMQHDRRQRLVIAVVAAGERRPSGSMRYAVEDLLAAGAVVHHLGQLGIDATSPEAAVCEAAYRDLQQAIGHLLTACVTATNSGRQSAGAADSSGTKFSDNEFMQ
jgi:hypothetical protein